jgi:hypothetical protein
MVLFPTYHITELKEAALRLAAAAQKVAKNPNDSAAQKELGMNTYIN